MDPWRPDDLLAIVTRLEMPAPDVREPVARGVDTPDGLRLRVLDWGGEGQPVLCLHGGALTARTWDYVAASLRRTHRVLALDMRGHGESAWSDRYPVDALAADAEAVVATLCEGPVHAVGMSLGGLAAAELALRAPQRVRSLTLVDVGPGAVFEATANMRAFMGAMTGACCVEQVIAQAYRVSGLRDRERIAYRMHMLLRQGDDGRWVWARDARRAVDFPHILARVNALSDKIGALEAPILLVRGARSKPFPAEAAAAFLARMRDGRFVEIADAGHNVQEDNPLDLYRALTAFFADAETQRAAPKGGPAGSEAASSDQSTTA